MNRKPIAIAALLLASALAGCAGQARTDAVNTTNAILRAARRVCSWIQAVPDLPAPPAPAPAAPRQPVDPTVVVPEAAGAPALSSGGGSQ